MTIRLAPESSGHSRKLRATLRAARKEQDLSAQQVADRLAAALGKRSMSGQAILYYEAFSRHPPVDVFAAWARVLGFRLIVDLDAAGNERKPMLVKHPEVSEIAHALDNAAPDVRAAVLTIVREMVR